MTREYQLTVHDLQIKYSNCYVKLLKPEANEAPIGIATDEVSTNNDKPVAMVITVFIEDGDHQTVVTKRTVPLEEIDFTRLTTGCINTPRAIWVIHSKKPDGNGRYRSALPASSVWLHDPLIHLREKMDIRIIDAVDEHSVLTAWGTNEYISSAKALSDVESGEYLARAFDSRFYFTISSNTDDIVLMYYGDVAGRVVKGTIILMEWAGRFKESLETLGLSCEIGGETR